MTDTTTASSDRELPYEGTVQDFRTETARAAYRGQQAITRIWEEHRDKPGPMPTDAVEQNLIACAAANYGWALVGVLGWLSAEHPELAYRAAAMAQDIAMNGGNKWCEDIPYPPDGSAEVPNGD